MAISFIDDSLVFDKTTSSSLSMFRGTCVQGDMLIAFIAGKSYNATITPSLGSGWTSIGSSTNGSTVSGVDTGSTKIQVFYKIAGAIEPTSYSFSISNCTIFMGMIHTYRTTLNWNTPTGVGALNSTSTGWTNIVSNTTLALLENTYLPICFVANTDSSSILTIPSLNATNRTLASYDSNPITAYTTSDGDDGGMLTGYSSVTAASSTTPVNLSILSSGPSTDKGHAFIVQLTDYGGTGNDPFGQFGVFGI